MIENAIETGINQMIHPNPNIRARLQEHSLSECQYGCKYYQDPKTKVVVLSHNSSYGCKRTKSMIEREKTDHIFEDTNFWLVPLKDRVDPDVWKNLMAKTSGAQFSRIAESLPGVRKGFATLGEAMQDMRKSMKKLADNFQNAE